MKSLCFIAISSLFLFGSVNTVHSQEWKEKMGLTKKGKVYADKLTEEEIENLLGGRLNDDGITNDFHQQNLRKVVFHNSKLEPQSVNASNVKKKFSINDPVYFTFYLPYSLRNHLLYQVNESGNKLMDYYYDYKWKNWGGTTETPSYNAYGSTKIVIFIDGKEVKTGAQLNDVGFRSEKTAVSHWITADPAEKEVRKEWLELIQNLTVGEHEVKMVVYGYKEPNGTTTLSTIEPVASGSFTLVKKEGETFTPSYGVNWDSFQAKMNDAQLEAKILEAVQNYAKVNKYKEKITDVKINSRDWNITRKELTGVVTGRYIYVYCKSTWPNGTCKVQEYVLRQNHDGSDFQTSVYSTGPAQGSYPQAIDCD